MLVQHSVMWICTLLYIFKYRQVILISMHNRYASGNKGKRLGYLTFCLQACVYVVRGAKSNTGYVCTPLGLDRTFAIDEPSFEPRFVTVQYVPSGIR